MNQVDDIFFKTSLADIRRDIVTTGRLTNQKNHKMLIKAFSIVSNCISDDLIIYGDGEMREELEAYVDNLGLKNRVFLPGVTKEVSQVLSKAKMFVLSSDYEGMPNSLLEAMAVGIPCVSTDCPCGGPRDVLGKVGTNHLVEVGDPEAMAEALELFCNSSDQFQVDVIRRTKEASKIFSSKEVIKKWEEYIVGNE